MGNNLSLSQARAITTASFVVNFATQVYGMVSEPDMKQVADAVRSVRPLHPHYQPPICFSCSLYVPQTKSLYVGNDLRSQNHFAFSPNPYFIAGVFSLQSLIQVFWLRNLWKMPPPTVDEDVELAEVREASLAYSPIYSLGNFCIGTSHLVPTPPSIRYDSFESLTCVALYCISQPGG